jgi:hypothetical protein
VSPPLLRRVQKPAAPVRSKYTRSVRGRESPNAQVQHIGIAAAVALVVCGAAGLLASGAFGAFPPPPNDNFAAAQVVSGPYVKVHGTTLDATHEAGEPAQNTGNTVWYAWTAARNGPADAGTCDAVGSAFPRVYTGNAIANLTPVQARNVGCYYDPTETGRVVFRAVAGTTYRIAIDSPPTDPSNFPLELAERPDNDFFVDAAVLRGSFPIVARSDLANATIEPAELDPTGATLVDASLWYAWTAQRNGTVVFQLCGAHGANPSQLTPYSGGSLKALREVRTVIPRFHVSRCPLARKHSEDGLRAEAGKTYYFHLQGGETQKSTPFALVLNHEDLYDLAVRETASPRHVARGGVVRIEATVRNRGNVSAPPPGEPKTVLSLHVAAPGSLLAPANAKPLSAHVPGGHCVVGRIGIKAIGAYCRLPVVPPGRSIKVVSRVRADHSFDSYARLEILHGGNFPQLQDDRRGNNDQSIPIRPRG